MSIIYLFLSRQHPTTGMTRFYYLFFKAYTFLVILNVSLFVESNNLKYNDLFTFEGTVSTVSCEALVYYEIKMSK